MSKVWKGIAVDEPIVKGNLISFIFKDSHQWKNRTALECGYTGKVLTYGELQEVVGRWGAWLTRYRGDAPQPPVVARFALCSVEVAVVHLGTMAVGAVYAALSVQFGARELVAQLENCGATLIVAATKFLPRLKEALEKLGRQIPVVVIGDAATSDTSGLNVVATYEAIMKDESLTPVAPVELSGEESSHLIYTSGTTGFPKSAEHTHNSLIALEQALTHPDFYPRPAAAGDIEQTRLLLVRDFGLGYGLMCGFLSGLLLGDCLIIKQLDGSAFIEDIERLKINTVVLVTPEIPLLIRLGEERPDLQQTLRHVFVAGAAIPTAHVEAVHKLLANVFLQKLYGTSEAGVIAADPVGGGKVGFTGKICAGVSAKVLDDEGKMLPANKQGILHVKAPGMMKRYLNNPTATRKVIDDDGWYNTEDLALVDEDGYVRILDRIKEIIKLEDSCSASPTEIEHTILELTGVHEVCVVGVPEAEKGMDAIYAFVVMKPNLSSDVTEESIQSYVTQQLNRRKRPKRVIFVEDMLCNQNGKLDRKFFRNKASQLENNN